HGEEPSVPPRSNALALSRSLQSRNPTAPGEYAGLDQPKARGNRAQDTVQAEAARQRHPVGDGLGTPAKRILRSCFVPPFLKCICLCHIRLFFLNYALSIVPFQGLFSRLRIGVPRSMVRDTVSRRVPARLVM